MKVMKKYLIMGMAVCAMLFSSCKNENISVSREVKFEVNPFEVINGFVNNEVVSGDLAELDYGSSLRVNFLVYNSSGYLEASDVKYLPNYTSTANVSFDLADGEYVVVVTTDEVDYNGTVTLEYWNFTGKERLTELKITDAGYIGGESKILGLGHEKIALGAGKTSFHVNMKPVGALVIANIWDISHYNDVDVYNLLSNKTTSVCSFNADGSYNTYSEEASYQRYYVQRFYPSDFTTYGAYGYQYFFPMGETHFIWEAEFGDGTSADMTDDMLLSIEKEKTYQFTLDLGEGTYYFGEVGNSKSNAMFLFGKSLSKNTRESKRKNE
jgi:hypothetical protein